LTPQLQTEWRMAGVSPPVFAHAGTLAREVGQITFGENR
jgi:hypothetical protein